MERARDCYGAGGLRTWNPGGEAIPHLVELVELNDPWLNVNVAFALGEIAVMNDQVREVLSQLLASEHQQVVRQAIDAISFIQADAEPFLEQFMQFMTTDCEAWQRKEVERGWVAQEQIRLNVMFACVSLLTTATDPQRLEELFKSGLGIKAIVPRSRWKAASAWDAQRAGNGTGIYRQTNLGRRSAG